MAENCSITYSEAMAMDEIDLAIANAALDNYIKSQPKPKGKGGK